MTEADMHYKLAQDIVININGNVQILKEGTSISEATIDLDAPSDNAENQMLSIVQDWVDKFKSRFSDSGWNKIIGFLQPAIDAIHSGDFQAIKDATIGIASKSERLADINPKAKNALDQVHNLYTKLLGVARSVFGEDVNELINIINESSIKIKS